MSVVDDSVGMLVMFGVVFAMLFGVFILGHNLGQNEGARDQCEKEYVDAARCIKDPEDGEFWIPVYTTTVEVSE